MNWHMLIPIAALGTAVMLAALVWVVYLDREQRD